MKKSSLKKFYKEYYKYNCKPESEYYYTCENLFELVFYERVNGSYFARINYSYNFMKNDFKSSKDFNKYEDMVLFLKLLIAVEGKVI